MKNFITDENNRTGERGPSNLNAVLTKVKNTSAYNIAISELCTKFIKDYDTDNKSTSDSEQSAVSENESSEELSSDPTKRVLHDYILGEMFSLNNSSKHLAYDTLKVFDMGLTERRRLRCFLANNKDNFESDILLSKYTYPDKKNQVKVIFQTEDNLNLNLNPNPYPNVYRCALTKTLMDEFLIGYSTATKLWVRYFDNASKMRMPKLTQTDTMQVKFFKMFSWAIHLYGILAHSTIKEDAKKSEDVQKQIVKDAKQKVKKADSGSKKKAEKEYAHENSKLEAMKDRRKACLKQFSDDKVERKEIIDIVFSLTRAEADFKQSQFNLMAELLRNIREKIELVSGLTIREIIKASNRENADETEAYIMSYNTWDKHLTAKVSLRTFQYDALMAMKAHTDTKLLMTVASPQGEGKTVLAAMMSAINVGGKNIIFCCDISTVRMTVIMTAIGIQIPFTIAIDGHMHTWDWKNNQNANSKDTMLYICDLYTFDKCYEACKSEGIHDKMGESMKTAIEERNLWNTTAYLDEVICLSPKTMQGISRTICCLDKMRCIVLSSACMPTDDLIEPWVTAFTGNCGQSLESLESFQSSESCVSGQSERTRTNPNPVKVLKIVGKQVNCGIKLCDASGRSYISLVRDDTRATLNRLATPGVFSEMEDVQPGLELINKLEGDFSVAKVSEVTDGAIPLIDRNQFEKAGYETDQHFLRKVTKEPVNFNELFSSRSACSKYFSRPTMVLHAEPHEYVSNHLLGVFGFSQQRIEEIRTKMAFASHSTDLSEIFGFEQQFGTIGKRNTIIDTFVRDANKCIEKRAQFYRAFRDEKKAMRAKEREETARQNGELDEPPSPSVLFQVESLSKRMNFKDVKYIWESNTFDNERPLWLNQLLTLYLELGIGYIVNKTSENQNYCQMAEFLAANKLLQVIIGDETIISGSNFAIENSYWFENISSRLTQALLEQAMGRLNRQGLAQSPYGTLTLESSRDIERLFSNQEPVEAKLIKPFTTLFPLSWENCNKSYEHIRAQKRTERINKRKEEEKRMDDVLKRLAKEEQDKLLQIQLETSDKNTQVGTKHDKNATVHVNSTVHMNSKQSQQNVGRVRMIRGQPTNRGQESMTRTGTQYRNSSQRSNKYVPPSTARTDSRFNSKQTYQHGETTNSVPENKNTPVTENKRSSGRFGLFHQ